MIDKLSSKTSLKGWKLGGTPQGLGLRHNLKNFLKGMETAVGTFEAP